MMLRTFLLLIFGLIAFSVFLILSEITPSTW